MWTILRQSQSIEQLIQSSKKAETLQVDQSYSYARPSSQQNNKTKSPNKTSSMIDFN